MHPIIEHRWLLEPRRRSLNFDSRALPFLAMSAFLIGVCMLALTVLNRAREDKRVSDFPLFLFLSVLVAR